MSSGDPLRVGFELTVLELDASGTARAVRELRAALAERPDVDLVDLAHPRRRGTGGRLLRGLDRELRWFPVAAARHAHRAGVDLLHVPAALGPPGGRLPYVVTINDVLALDHPGWFSRSNALQSRLALGRLARRARRVIVPSEHTRARLLERTRAEPDRVRVVPYGVGEPFGPGAPDEALLERLGLRRPYVLTVATLQPRKNLEGALAVHAALRRSLPGVQLVVAGGRGWRDRQLVERLSAAPDVVLAGRVDDADLVGLLRVAGVLLHPSAHEGFGFPPLEAMACGTPVVAAQGGSVPEVVGDAGVLVDMADPQAGADAVAALLADEALRARLSQRGLERAARLTWGACADQVVRVYREAVRG